MVTFEGTVFIRDKYYGKYEKQVKTRRGFFHKSDGYYNSKDEWIETPNGYISVPPKWKVFHFTNGESELLPSGWGGYRVLPEKVIKWEYTNN